MSQTQLNLVPSSIQRIRCFLGQQGRMKVKPWAGVEETLDAFHRSLVLNRRNDAFWEELAGLLQDLAHDMRRRFSSTPGSVIDNEALNPTRHRELIEEIRQALDRPRPSGFQRLASSLSAPAVTVLFLLGGTVVVGCDKVPESPSDTDDSKGGDTATVSMDEEDNGRDTGEDTRETGYSDSDTDTDSDSDSDADADSDSDADADSDSDSDADMMDEKEHLGMTFEEIVMDCISSKNEQKELISCMDAMHASWKTGLTELFQNSGCGDVLYHLDCLRMRQDFCTEPNSAGEYDLDKLLDNCAILVYLAVRFE